MNLCLPNALIDCKMIQTKFMMYEKKFEPKRVSKLTWREQANHETNPLQKTTAWTHTFCQHWIDDDWWRVKKIFDWNDFAVDYVRSKISKPNLTGNSTCKNQRLNANPKMWDGKTTKLCIDKFNCQNWTCQHLRLNVDIVARVRMTNSLKN